MHVSGSVGRAGRRPAAALSWPARRPRRRPPRPAPQSATAPRASRRPPSPQTRPPARLRAAAQQPLPEWAREVSAHWSVVQSSRTPGPQCGGHALGKRDWDTCASPAPCSAWSWHSRFCCRLAAQAHAVRALLPATVQLRKGLWTGSMVRPMLAEALCATALHLLLSGTQGRGSTAAAVQPVLCYSALPPRTCCRNAASGGGRAALPAHPLARRRPGPAPRRRRPARRRPPRPPPDRTRLWPRRAGRG